MATIGFGFVGVCLDIAGLALAREDFVGDVKLLVLVGVVVTGESRRKYLVPLSLLDNESCGLEVVGLSERPVP